MWLVYLITLWGCVLYESKLNKFLISFEIIWKSFEFITTKCTFNKSLLSSHSTDLHTVICTNKFRRLELIHNYLKKHFKIIQNYLKTISELFQNYFRTISKLFKTIQNYTKLYKTIQNYTKLYKTIQKLFRTIQKLFRTIQNYLKSHAISWRPV